MDVATGKRRRLTPPTQGRARLLRATRSSRRTARPSSSISDRGSEFRHVACDRHRHGARAGARREPQVRRRGHRPLREGEAPRLRHQRGAAPTCCASWTSARARRRRGPPSSPGVISGLRWRADGGEIAFTHASARSPGDVFSYDLGEHRVTRWTNGNSPALNAAAFARAAHHPLEELRRARDHRASTTTRRRSFEGVRPGRGERARRARVPGARGLHRPQQLPRERAGHRAHLPERARLLGLRQELPQAGQRAAARGLGEGPGSAPRLDRHAAGPGREPRAGDGRQLRRLHGARRERALRRAHRRRREHGGHLQLRHLPRAHRDLPARPAPRRVRRRARPRRCARSSSRSRP